MVPSSWSRPWLKSPITSRCLADDGIAAGDPTKSSRKVERRADAEVGSAAGKYLLALSNCLMATLALLSPLRFVTAVIDIVAAPLQRP
jgi:hypothetical protein